MSWERARAFILPALKDATEAELIESLASGHSMLWEGQHSAFVTQITPDPRSIHAWLAGGDMNDLMSLVPGIESYGRAIGCRYATAQGRRGWGRVLKYHGYVREGDELKKRL